MVTIFMFLACAICVVLLFKTTSTLREKELELNKCQAELKKVKEDAEKAPLGAFKDATMVLLDKYVRDTLVPQFNGLRGNFSGWQIVAHPCKDRYDIKMSSSTGRTVKVQVYIRKGNKCFNENELFDTLRCDFDAALTAWNGVAPSNGEKAEEKTEECENEKCEAESESLLSNFYNEIDKKLAVLGVNEEHLFFNIPEELEKWRDEIMVHVSKAGYIISESPDPEQGEFVAIAC